MRLPAACARKFRVERELSAGGFGTVVLATQLQLERPVALKLLHPEILADAEQRERFANEARVTASIDHPHIVRVLDHGVDEGVPWIAYEYLPGRTLAAAMAEAERDWRTAATAGMHVAAALQAAHDAGVLHRDVKPENVLEATPGHWKITDFGIAKWTAEGQVKTKTGVVLGTPAFMAPELLRGEPATAQTDVYALGALLYRALSGRPPFDGDHPLKVMQARLSGEAPRLASLAPWVPEQLAALVDTLVAMDPGRRAVTARRVREALEAMLAGDAPGSPAAPRAPQQRVTSTRRAVPGSGSITRPAEPPRTAGMPAPPARGPASRLPLVAGGALALLAVAALAPRGARPPVPPLTSTPPAAASPAANAADVARALAAFEADLELTSRTLVPGPSLLGLIERLVEADATALPRVIEQIERFATAHRRKRARLAELDERLRAADTEGAWPAARARALRARLDTGICVEELDLDHCEKLLAVARDVRAGKLAIAPMTGAADVTQRMLYSPERRPYLRRALASQRAALEDVALRPEAATAHHGVLFERVRWLASQFAFYPFEGRRSDTATMDAERFLFRPLSARQEPRAALVLALARDAWQAGMGELKLTSPAALAEVTARVDRLQAAVPSLGASLSELRGALQRTAGADRPVGDAKDRIFAIVAPRLGYGGLALAVLRRGQVLERRFFGLADIEHHVKVGPGTVFDLAALAKPFTGLALLLSVDRGSTKLEESVRVRVPEVPVVEGVPEPTLAQLARQTSGLPDVAQMPERAGVPRTTTAVLAWLAGRKASAERPGHFAYNDLDYMLIAAAVERAANVGFAELLRRDVFAKAGMATARVLDGSPSPMPGRAVSYCFGVQPCRKDEPLPGAGHMFATLDDMIAWEKALAARAWLTRADLRAAYYEGAAGQRADFAFGWGKAEVRGHKVLWADGEGLGASGHVARYVDGGLTVIILCNAAKIDVEAIQRDLAEMYLE